MKLPRWTVYPAVLVLGVLIFVAIPRPSGSDPYEGAAAAAGGSVATRPMAHKPVIVLGIDGMDPDLLKEVIQLYPERMENFRWLIQSGDGIQSLGTSTPPQSPVAWSNFITGQNPGGHGIFDFLHRDPVTRAPIPSTVVIEEGRTIRLPGKWQLAIGADSPSNRTGRSFWSILADHGVPADIWRMPINFPVETSKGVSFPGMMTPALDSAYGQCSFYTTDPMRMVEIDYDKLHQVTEYEGKIVTTLQGPGNPFREYGKGEEAHQSVALTILVDRESNAALIDTGTEKVILQPGQWSDFLQVDFEMLPLKAMSMSGICRFYLRSLEPEVELYASPVNLNPESPPTPVSAPADASAELAAGIGRYYTQGMAEDVNSLKKGILTDAEFMAQVDLVYRERRGMLEYALDRYLEDDEGGLLFFYFSTVDLSCHMMWRHFDASHPAHDPEIARQDSSWWSQREGSTWKDTVHDLYLKMDPVLGRIRGRLGDEVTLIVMSDHGFAPYRRMFNLNTWLLENGYLVLHEGKHKELDRNDPDWRKVKLFDPGVVDWSQTRAYGVGFNGLYLNLADRELDNPETDEDESGIVPLSDAADLMLEIKEQLEAIRDQDTGLQAILRCDLASDVYSGERLAEAPDMLIGFNAGYGNSDASSLGRIPCYVLEDNSPAAFGGKLGTFNGSHLMAPEVVSGVLISNRPIREGEHQLEDLTVELLQQYGVEAPQVMQGHRVLE